MLAARSLKHLSRIDWIEPGRAADLFFDFSGDVRKLSLLIEVDLARFRIDVIVQPVQHRQRSLLLADMDSTMIGQECIDELADMVGVKAQVAEITERAMRGELDFEPALEERVALLKGLPVSVIAQVIDERIALTSGAQALVQAFRAAGGHTCLVSGGFTHFTGVIAQKIGFDEHHANVLEIENEQLTGRVVRPILGRASKAERLVVLCIQRQIPIEKTLAIGDGANDLDMIERAGLGVAYHAKPTLAAAADARIHYGDLSVLSYALGLKP